MPYEWTQDTTEKRLTLWPYRSLPRRGFVAFVLATFFMILLPLIGLLGTILLWGLLPFLLLAVGAIWWGLERSYKDGEICEELCLNDTRASLTRTNPNGAVQSWETNPYWAKINLHPKGGPVPYYVTLSGSGREVEIGAFLSEDERKAMFAELSDVLRSYSGLTQPDVPIGPATSTIESPFE